MQRTGPPTIQGVLTDAARALCGPATRVTGASRTDAGVHALGQTVSLTTTSALIATAIRGGLNAALPREIRVLSVEAVPDGFDARRSALAKRYLYVIDNARTPLPLLARYAWHVPVPLDVPRMRAALRPLVGRHDFSAFRAAAGRDKVPVCHVKSLHVLRRKQRLVVLVSADRFLHHMVRVIVGTAVEVGRGARGVGWVADVLHRGDRRHAGPTAPAHGLCLVRVLYPRGPALSESECWPLRPSAPGA